MSHHNAIDHDIPEPEDRGRGTRHVEIVPRILLADDREEIRWTVASLLEEHFDIVGFAENGKQVLELVAQCSPDVLVLDIFMPVLNGIETAACLLECGCPCKVLFLTAHEDSDFLEAAIALCAVGYVLKPHLATELIPAIRSVLQGHCYISTHIRSS
jgi:DNA-binding NarL/FixJ family response regulator